MNDYAQLLSLLTGGQQTPADLQQTGQPSWMQWLSGGAQQPGGGASGGKNLSGMGTALAGAMGAGPLAGL